MGIWNINCIEDDRASQLTLDAIQSTGCVGHRDEQQKRIKHCCTGAMLLRHQPDQFHLNGNGYANDSINLGSF